MALEKLTPYDSQIKIALWKLRKDNYKHQEPITMGPYHLPNPNPPFAPLTSIGQYSLRDYTVPIVDGIHSSIRRLGVQANDYEIKPTTIKLMV